MLSTIALVATCAASHAATIATVKMSGWGLVLGRGILPPQVNLRFSLSNTDGGCWISGPACFVMADLVLTPADIGRTFSINAASNADFQLISSSLSDGVDNAWSFSNVSNAGGAVSMPTTSATPSGGGGPDFSGYNVHEVDLTINNLVFRQVSLPAGAALEVFTEVVPDVTISVQGTAIPEPGAGLLLISGTLLLPLRRLLRSRHPR